MLYIDDAYILTIGHSITETHEKLHDTMERDGGVFQWAAEHNCGFGIDKFQLLDLTHRREPHLGIPGKTCPISRPDVQLRGHVVKSDDMAKFLGVIIDRELQWKAQGAAMVEKGKAWVAQVQRIAKVTRGVPSHLVRRLYLAVAVPKMMYAADICLESSRRVGGAGSATIVAKLAAVQRKAAIAITGAMKTTATDILDAHANLLPMQLLVEKMRARAAIRMATLPKSHPLEQHIRRVATRRIK